MMVNFTPDGYTGSSESLSNAAASCIAVVVNFSGRSEAWLDTDGLRDACFSGSGTDELLVDTTTLGAEVSLDWEKVENFMAKILHVSFQFLREGCVAR